jgi:pyridoxamine 5'-phosphate oxidase
VSKEESDSYFLSRPFGSQIGAWTSPQSQEIKSREELTQKEMLIQERFKNEKISRPSHWGGYRLIPIKIEFWQGRASRLHDRIAYRFEGENWVIARLAP